MAIDNLGPGHDHAWRAIAALQAVVLAKGFLHRVQLVTLSQALDSGDVRSLAGQRQYRAGFNTRVVQMHGATAALGGIATDVGAGESEMLAQELHKQRAAFNLATDGLAVDGHVYHGHGVQLRINVQSDIGGGGAHCQCVEWAL